MSTILDLYQQTASRLSAAGIADAETESTIILRHFLQCRRADIFLHGNIPAAMDVSLAVEEVLTRRLTRVPLAYLLGEQEFYGRTFVVSPDVLIPRQETELLIEKAGLFLGDAVGSKSGKILDLGTGSGVIAITLALEHSRSELIAVDRSLGALKIARTNAIAHGVSDRILWLNSNWSSAITEGIKFDLVVANPPYVADRVRAMLQPELAAEPAMALFGGDEGTDEVGKIIHESSTLLNPGGALLMEIGYDQEVFVTTEAQDNGQFDSIVVHRDYAGHPRLLEARKK